jgi:hypothetical protein
MHREPHGSRPIKLLSIGKHSTRDFDVVHTLTQDDEDGGGVQGLAALITIRELMRRIQGERGVLLTPHPYEHFDLIVGTGIGGYVFFVISSVLRLMLSFEA